MSDTKAVTARINKLMQAALNQRVFPGAELLVAQGNQLVFHQAYGKTTGSDPARAMETGHVYDLASLTKPLATAPAVLKLWEAGLLDLEAPLVELLPLWKGNPKVTCMDLLTHRSGLPAWLPLYQSNNLAKGYSTLFDPPGCLEPHKKVCYSCLNYLILGRLVSKLSGQSLEDYCRNQLHQPLGLESFTFNPGRRPKVVETTFCPWRNRRLKGEVQDENAAFFTENEGNAGLFGTARDIWDFLLMLLDPNSEKIFTKKSRSLMTENQNPLGLAARTVGWDFFDRSEGYWSCGSNLSVGSFGHLGYTGTGIWVDPKTQGIYIHLTNRVWFGATSKLPEMKALRPLLHDQFSQLLL